MAEKKDVSFNVVELFKYYGCGRDFDGLNQLVLVVTNDGLRWEDEDSNLYTVTNYKTFLGFSEEKDATEPEYVVGDKITFTDGPGNLTILYVVGEYADYMPIPLSTIDFTVGTHTITVTTQSGGQISPESNAVTYTPPCFEPPVISMDGNTLNISPKTKPYSTIFQIYINGELTHSTSATSESLGWLVLGVGTHSVYVIQTASGFAPSAKSNTVEYIVTPTEGLEYSLSSGYYTCSGIGTATDTDIVIASEVDGLPVKAVSANAFKNKGITSITVPDSVFSIGAEAFRGCNLLKGMRFPGVGRLRDWFGYVTVVYGNGPDGTILQDSYSLTLRSVWSYIPNSLRRAIVTSGTSVPTYQFMNCDFITHIELPEGITEIAEYSFNQCGIKSIKIPASVTAMGKLAFYACPLTKVTFGENSQLTSIGDSAFSSTGSMEIVIPAGVTYFGNEGFAGSSVKKISFEENSRLEEIGDFGVCRNLESIEIPSGVTTIKSYAFADCNSLESAIFKNPNGWYYWYNSSTNTKKTIPSEKLSDPASAAALLTTGTTEMVTWHRE